MDLNSRIRELVDGKLNYGLFGDIKDSVKNYTDCLDYNILDSDLRVGLKRLYQLLNINEFSKDISCILTNSVNGKIADALIENIHIFCFYNDFYCSTISQIVNENKNKMDKIEFLFADISQFFTFNYNKNFIADFVINTPNGNQYSYKDLDYEMKYRLLNPYEYYTIRSLEFIQTNGIVLSIIPTNKVNGILELTKNYETPIRLLDRINFTKGYSFIYLKKV